MKKLIEILTNFVKEEDGAIAVEYILLIIFVALAVLAAAGTFATSVSGRYDATATVVGTAEPTLPNTATP